MRVRMKVGLAGPALNLAPGDEHDFPDAEARRLIAADYAVAVDIAPPREFAVIENPAIERREKRKRGNA